MHWLNRSDHAAHCQHIMRLPLRFTLKRLYSTHAAHTVQYKTKYRHCLLLHMLFPAMAISSSPYYFVPLTVGNWTVGTSGRGRSPESPVCFGDLFRCHCEAVIGSVSRPILDRTHSSVGGRVYA